VDATTRAQNSITSVLSLVKEIGESQPVLRVILDEAIQQLSRSGDSDGRVTPNAASTRASYTGRRLLVRREYAHTLSRALSTHPMQRSVGANGIPGVTSMVCEALCEAAARDQANIKSATDLCSAYAFRRDDAFSATDLAGHCWLLHSGGACKSEVCRHWSGTNFRTGIV